MCQFSQARGLPMSETNRWLLLALSINSSETLTITGLLTLRARTEQAVGMVVPVEARAPVRASVVDRVEPGRERGPVLGRLELRFAEGVVAGGVRATIRLRDPEVGQRQTSARRVRASSTPPTSGTPSGSSASRRPTRATDRGLDQQAVQYQASSHRSLISNTKRLSGLEKLRRVTQFAHFKVGVQCRVRLSGLPQCPGRCARLSGSG